MGPNTPYIGHSPQIPFDQHHAKKILFRGFIRLFREQTISDLKQYFLKANPRQMSSDVEVSFPTMLQFAGFLAALLLGATIFVAQVRLAGKF